MGTTLGILSRMTNYEPGTFGEGGRFAAVAITVELVPVMPMIALNPKP